MNYSQLSQCSFTSGGWKAVGHLLGTLFDFFLIVQNLSKGHTQKFTHHVSVYFQYICFKSLGKSHITSIWLLNPWLSWFGMENKLVRWTCWPAFRAQAKFRQADFSTTEAIHRLSAVFGKILEIPNAETERLVNGFFSHRIPSKHAIWEWYISPFYVSRCQVICKFCHAIAEMVW